MKIISVVLLAATVALNPALAAAQTINTVETVQAPAPGGHYSQGVVANGFVFVSGQLSIKPGGGHEIPASIEAQTRQALSNADATSAPPRIQV